MYRYEGLRPVQYVLFSTLCMLYACLDRLCCSICVVYSQPSPVREPPSPAIEGAAGATRGNRGDAQTRRIDVQQAVKRSGQRSARVPRRLPHRSDRQAISHPPRRRDGVCKDCTRRSRRHMSITHGTPIRHGSCLVHLEHLAGTNGGRGKFGSLQPAATRAA